MKEYTSACFARHCPPGHRLALNLAEDVDCKGAKEWARDVLRGAPQDRLVYVPGCYLPGNSQDLPLFKAPVRQIWGFMIFRPVDN